MMKHIFEYAIFPNFSQWIQDTYEVNENFVLPLNLILEQYIAYCNEIRSEPKTIQFLSRLLNTVFPNLDRFHSEE